MNQLQQRINDLQHKTAGPGTGFWTAANPRTYMAHGLVGGVQHAAAVGTTNFKQTFQSARDLARADTPVRVGRARQILDKGIPGGVANTPGKYKQQAIEAQLAVNSAEHLVNSKAHQKTRTTEADQLESLELAKKQFREEHPRSPQLQNFSLPGTEAKHFKFYIDSNSKSNNPVVHKLIQDALAAGKDHVLIKYAGVVVNVLPI